MENIYAIKAHIKGMDSTRKVTRSMKLVSASKLHRVQSLLASFAAYSDNCREALVTVLSGAEGVSPLMRENTGGEADRVCYVVFVGNRGLCGAYNQDMMAFLRQTLSEDEGRYRCVIVGRWGAEAEADGELRVLRRFADMEDVPSPKDGAALAEYLKGLFLDGDFDRVELLYQKRFHMGQRPEALTLLPLQLEEGEGDGRELIFEPDRETLTERLCQLYVDSSIYRVLLESRTSEHYARMAAMTAATDNADQLMQELSLKLNRTRQAKITTELTEIIGSSSALGRGNAD